MLYKVTNEFYESVIATGKYKKLYYPETIVTADDKTLGIMLFDDLIPAMSFTELFDNHFKIVVAKPLSQKNYIDAVSFCADNDDLDYFYSKEISIWTAYKYYGRKPPEGTICYHKIEVVRELMQEEIKYMLGEKNEQYSG